MNKDERHWRYTRTKRKDGTLWSVLSGYDADTVNLPGGAINTGGEQPIEAEPDWLKAIVAVAIAGGHIYATAAPPPSSILWFTTNKDCELIRFIKLRD